MSAFLPGAGTTPGLRRPVAEVSFGRGSAADWQRSIVSVVVETALAPGVDVAEIHLFGGSTAPELALGDAGTVALGYEDSGAQLVFTGRIDHVQHSVHGTTRLMATNGGASLAALRAIQSYEQETAGGIARDLAGRAGTETGTLDDGVEFPFYLVDDRSGAYQQIADLARKSGFVAFVTPEDQLVFGPASSGRPAATFTYGVDILALEARETTPLANMITVIGEGAAGTEGRDAWSWLVKDPAGVKRTAGSASPEQVVVDRALRSGEAVQSAADGLAEAGRLQSFAGKLLVVGNPVVGAGSVIEVVEAPSAALNGVCLARQVRHRFAKRTGFTTLIAFSKTGEGGLGGLGGLL